MPEHNELCFSKGLKGANKKCPQDASLEQLLKDVSSFTLEPVVVLLFHVMTASFKVNGYPVSAKNPQDNNDKNEYNVFFLLCKRCKV